MSQGSGCPKVPTYSPSQVQSRTVQSKDEDSIIRCSSTRTRAVTLSTWPRHVCSTGKDTARSDNIFADICILTGGARASAVIVLTRDIPVSSSQGSIVCVLNCFDKRQIWIRNWFDFSAQIRTRFLSLAQSKLRLCSANPWWRHQMETFSALLAICAGNSPVPGECPTPRPVTRGFDVSFDRRLNKRLSEQSWGWWFETPSRPLWRHRNDRPVYWSNLPCD